MAIAPVVEEQLFWVVREALHNVVKHADATSVQVHIDAEADRQGLQITVTDDGNGFDSGAGRPGHLGLQSMTERMAQVGGSLQITSGPSGSVVRARAPGLVGPCAELSSTGSG